MQFVYKISNNTLDIDELLRSVSFCFHDGSVLKGEVAFVKDCVIVTIVDKTNEVLKLRIPEENITSNVLHVCSTTELVKRWRKLNFDIVYLGNSFIITNYKLTTMKMGERK